MKFDHKFDLMFNPKFDLMFNPKFDLKLGKLRPLVRQHFLH